MDQLDFFTNFLPTQGLIFSEFTAVCNKTVWSYYSLIEGGIWILLNKTVCIIHLLPWVWPFTPTPWINLISLQNLYRFKN